MSCNDTNPGITGNSDLTRPKYSAGLLLQDSDLTQAVDFTHNLSMLLLRSMLGCGVLCGLKVDVKAETDKTNCTDWHITIHPGVALDCRGRLINVQTIQHITWHHDLCKPEPAAPVWVTLAYHETSCMPRDVSCQTQENASSHANTRICSGWYIDVTPVAPKHACDNATKNSWLNDKDGKCPCGCASDYNIIVLAKIDDPNDNKLLPTTDHSVRSYIRPQLAADPLLARNNSHIREPDAAAGTAGGGTVGTGGAVGGTDGAVGAAAADVGAAAADVDAAAAGAGAGAGAAAGVAGVDAAAPVPV